ncbi:MAG: hypothetical protein ACR2QF_15940 [Geminicoccaceae bacterium]
MAEIKLSVTSRTNFVTKFGEQTKGFIKRCDGFSVQLSDAAESEKSEPLRKCLHETSAQIEDLVDRLNTMLGASS